MSKEQPKQTKSQCNNKQSRFFNAFASNASHATGTSIAFATALGVVLAWGVTGPVFDFSDTWQLVINTGTTIITFLMVFLIQNTQNRDNAALHLKLDELILAMQGAQNSFIDLEDLTQEELDSIKAHLMKLKSRRTDSTDSSL